MPRAPGPEFAPPAYPPPLLSGADLHELIERGYLSVTVPPRLTEQYKKLFDAFGDIFEQETEAKLEQFPSLRGVEHGYNLIEGEKEFVTLRAEEPQDEELQNLLRAVWRDTAAFLCRALGDIARVLQIPYFAFEPLLDGCLSLPPDLDQSTPTLLRIFRYFAGVGTAEKHSDIGLLTLCYGTGRGLEVWEKNDSGGQWRDAGQATLLVGESLRILSSGRVAAGQHRVVPQPSGRSSIVFALRPSLRHQIDLIPFGGYGMIDSKLFWEKVRKTKYNINEQKDVRERQKQEQKERMNAASAAVESGAGHAG